MKKFAVAFFIYSGPLAYEFLQQNLSQALPSLRTVRRFVHNEFKPITEGEFRFDDLVAYLNEHKLPKVISIAEDATRVISRVEYDSESDRCVGFVLPSSKNGTLLVDSFLAVSFKAIEKMFTNAKIAKYAYLYMAKPLGSSNVSAFCLSCFGTDNKFKTEHIVLRWKYILEECQKRGIRVLTLSSDGDSRLLTGMRMCTGLKLSNMRELQESNAIPKSNQSKVPHSWHSWWSLKRPLSVSFVQDTVHIAVKLKCRLLKPSIVLPMGSFVAGVHHLRILQETIGKDKHGLRERDVDPKDKQNFDAVTNIIRAGRLLETIPDSMGTKTYIDLLECVVDSYLSNPSDPIQCIEKIWFVTFFLRYWRLWTKLHTIYTLSDNFITPNAYICIELNAHSLISTIRTIRDTLKMPDVFCPGSFGSQSCEALFRSARSMSSTFSTFINFGLLGLLRRIHRLQIQSIIQAESSSLEITFPQLKKHTKKNGDSTVSTNSASQPQNVCELSDADIASAVQRAKLLARKRIEKLGMVELLKDHNLWDDEPSLTEDCDVVFSDCTDDSSDEEFVENPSSSFEEKNSEFSCSYDMSLSTDSNDIKNDIEQLYENELISPSLLNTLQRSLQKISTSNSIPLYGPMKSSESPEKCSEPLKKKLAYSRRPFVEVHPNVFIRKTTVLWLFQEGERVSSDRLFRVRTNQPFAFSGTKLTKSYLSNGQLPITSKMIHIGDTCVFKVGEQNKHFNIGKVLQFKRLNIERKQKQEYNKVTVTMQISPNLGVLCSWFERQAIRRYKLLNNPAISHKFISCSQYLCTLTDSCIEETVSDIEPVPISLFQFNNTNNPKLAVSNEILITKECEQFINEKCSSMHPSSAMLVDLSSDSCASNVKTSSSSLPVIASSDTIVNSIDSFESTVWKKIGTFHLYHHDQSVLQSQRAWLNDNHINCAQLLLQKQFPHLNGLKSTVLQSCTNPAKSLSQNSLQILHISGNHWIALSTLNSDATDSCPTVYDSKYRGVSIETQTILAHFIRRKSDETDCSVAIANVIQQSGSSDCGLFAIAFITHLAHGLNPVYYNFNQKAMREHFLKCIIGDALTPFPTSSQRTNRLSRIKEIITFKLYCYCRLPDDGSKMVACENNRKEPCKLGGWFHLKCIHSDDLEVEKNRKWTCKNCR